MPTDLFTFVDLYTRALGTADHLLSKGVERANSLGISEQEMLDWRLIGDMRPLRFQIMVVCNFAQQWPARVAGLPVPQAIDDQHDIEGFRAAIATSRAFLAGLRAEQINGRGDVPITFAIGPNMEPTLPAARWLTVFATTNLYFHLSTAYGILRANGTQIGKVDLFATGL
ncbi:MULTISPECIES: DUF1993 domain-containing protein [unclassified Beijerinckia]|uniref:DUF1993 domain-containing protein n=1 Tax=unclassified Beijerinckia TaxID=2638183 RepID=UPI000894B308|nr:MULTISPECIES: DUF1993 domain-containing protein [unclassified Beijerinckia]MDH7795499.1 hypothetical protein [Beijerinckia sp. GAS462]SEC04119.1 hypothetical protein SAMN05443249_1774 [Beijerinckia sp. 28-YEA-48]